MIDFNVPPYIGTEMKYIEEAVAKNHKICGDGPFTKRCNEWLEKRTGTAKALLTTSCTHATEMAALLADIKEGDEIIMPSYTFVSTADAFVLRGAVPVFVDIRPDTMNIDENKIEAAITEKTKAIVPVHYAGVSCEMDKIMELAEKYHLLVIEDAAQGIMSTYSMRQRTTVWERAVPFSSRIRLMWNVRRLSVRKVPTVQNSSVDRLINIPGWMQDLPTCRVI